MSETLFAFDKNNYQDCQQAYRGGDNQEYYLGDYSIEAGSIIDVRAEKKSVGPSSIIRLCSKTRLSFKRSWHHIRKDATDVIVLWFVKQGSLTISHSGEHGVAHAGDFAITKSMTPFAIECSTDEDEMHDVLHVLVPSHVFREFIPQDVTTGFTVPAGGQMFSLIEHMLTGVLENNGEIQPRTEQSLLNSALSLLADSITGYDNLIRERQSIAEQRLETVLRYIEIHLSDPKLSTSMVSEACGISPRYLSFLLKQQGTSFSEHIWDERLKIASRWLATSKPSDISIAEIAFRVGFKSPAHFSRMFKRVFGKGPREYRADALTNGENVHSDAALNPPSVNKAPVKAASVQPQSPERASSAADLNESKTEFFMGNSAATLQ
ncbi:helix-turn-helix transcriptional regulator [Aestuariicella hydrocarbonica]|uniref:Helix-turn-helix transcriptional regulator n=1 Tax=Pseudomaricurvus hydrocarbonicus TaxID=1470433 RepID=A0A9E5JS98_9GAMM|nr:AraC family transcriptional regulator [Aestuariicella hydrocarbonica]NHO65892.1 helix-turn-helix transcriptional regulator [Aestuariicella hydrocarbonica]